MYVRSMTWRPVAAYGYFASLTAIAWTCLVVVGFFARNPATATWAVLAAPIYLLLFLLPAVAMLGAVMVLRAFAFQRSPPLYYAILATVAGLIGVIDGLLAWWMHAFEPSPYWFLLVSAVLTSAAYFWYSNRYENSRD